MSKKIKADMGKLEEIQTILENNAKKITHNITRIGELHKEIDVCWESQMWDSCYKTYCDLKKEFCIRKEIWGTRRNFYLIMKILRKSSQKVIQTKHGKIL